MEDLELAEGGPGARGDAGTVGESLPCARCSYDLRGLARAGRCPECGEPVRAALRALHPAGGGQTPTYEFARALRFNGFSWYSTAVIFLPCPCSMLAWGFSGASGYWLLGPQIVLLMLLSIGRLLTLIPMNAVGSTIRKGLPGHPWPLVAASGFSVLAAVATLALGPGPALLAFGFCILAEGLIWTVFVTRTAMKLECPYANPLGKVGMGVWCVALLFGLMVSISMTTNASQGGNGNDWGYACAFMVTWLAYVVASITSGLFCVGLADVLPQLLAPVEEDPDELGLPESRGREGTRPGSEVETPPIELADSTDTEIRTREDRGLHPPPSRDDQTEGAGPDVY